jgi:tripartite-type tricarboxylate transporter receptor subunit TctC
MAGSPSFTTPEELMAFTKSEIEAWRKIVRAANIKIE